MFIFRHLPIISTILASTLVVMGVFALLFYLGLQDHLSILLKWIGELGYWAAVMFIIIDCFVVVLLLPGLIFTVSAGFIFGFLQGVLVVVIGTSLGATLAFVVSRHLFNETFKSYLREHKRFSLFNKELVAEGWKVILLSRMIPFFPFKLSNYFFGAADYKFNHFLIGTALGVIPITAFNVYLGSLVSDINHIMSLDYIALSPFTGWLYGIGFFMAVFLLVYIFHLAQKALTRYSQLEKGDKEKSQPVRQQEGDYGA